MRRIAVLVALVALCLPIFAQEARAASPEFVSADYEDSIVDGCTTTNLQVLLSVDPTTAAVGIELDIYFDRWNTCTGTHIFQIQGQFSPKRGLSFDTYGANINLHTRMSNFANYGEPDYEGDVYEVWLTFRFQCQTILERYHPGVNCDATMIGHASFGKWFISAPKGNHTYLRWA